MPGFRGAIIAIGAAGLMAIPTVMVLGGKPARTASVVALTGFGVDRNDPEFKPPHESVVALATPTPTAPPATAAASRSAVKPSVAPTHSATSPPPAPAVPSFSHVFVIVMENHESGSIIGSSAAPLHQQPGEQLRPGNELLCRVSSQPAKLPGTDRGEHVRDRQ